MFPRNLVPFGNKKMTRVRRRRSTKVKKLEKNFKTSSKMRRVFWSIKLRLLEAERQGMEIQLESSFNICRESARITVVNENLIHRFYVIL
jgi:hypothetical protein